MRAFLACLLLTFLTACQQGQPAAGPKEKFDAIEHITGTANWQMVDGADTSYLYFSRMGDTHFTVYRFSIRRGDSAGTQTGNIVNRQDSVIWNRGDKQLLLTNVNERSATWKDMLNSRDSFLIEKTDSLHMVFVLPGGRQVAMQLTLPLSTFLVRRKYDYIHGTSYTDSPVVQPRKSVRVTSP